MALFFDARYGDVASEGMATGDVQLKKYFDEIEEISRTDVGRAKQMLSLAAEEHKETREWDAFEARRFDKMGKTKDAHDAYVKALSWDTYDHRSSDIHYDFLRMLKEKKIGEWKEEAALYDEYSERLWMDVRSRTSFLLLRPFYKAGFKLRKLKNKAIYPELIEDNWEPAPPPPRTAEFTPLPTRSQFASVDYSEPKRVLPDPIEGKIVLEDDAIAEVEVPNGDAGIIQHVHHKPDVSTGWKPWVGLALGKISGYFIGEKVGTKIWADDVKRVTENPPSASDYTEFGRVAQEEFIRASENYREHLENLLRNQSSYELGVGITLALILGVIGYAIGWASYKSDQSDHAKAGGSSLSYETGYKIGKYLYGDDHEKPGIKPR